MLLLLFVLVAFLFVGFLAVVATVGVTVGSLVTLLTAPGQLLKLLRDRALRRNHALEHATISVIEERFGKTNLSGMAQPEGFIIRGGAPLDLVAGAAEEALARLRAGERRLAIHPRCGTTLVASHLVMALAFLAVLVVTHQLSLLPFLAGILAAAVLGPRLSPILQRFVTTDASVGSLAIAGVEIDPIGGAGGLMSLLAFPPILVRTRQDDASPRLDEVTLITGDREEIATGRYRIR